MNKLQKQFRRQEGFHFKISACNPKKYYIKNNIITPGFYFEMYSDWLEKMIINVYDDEGKYQ